MLLRVGRMPLESNLHAKVSGMDETRIYSFQVQLREHFVNHEYFHFSSVQKKNLNFWRFI